MPRKTEVNRNVEIVQGSIKVYADTNPSSEGSFCAWSFEAQLTQVAIGCDALNRMLGGARLKSVRRSKAAIAPISKTDILSKEKSHIGSVSLAIDELVRRFAALAGC